MGEKKKICSGKRRFVVFALLLSTMLPAAFSVVRAQDEAAENSNQTNGNAADVNADAAPTPIPFSEIVAQTQSADASLKALAADVADDSNAAVVERELPDLTNTIDAQTTATARVVNGRPSLENLRKQTSIVALQSPRRRTAGQSGGRARITQTDARIAGRTTARAGQSGDLERYFSDARAR